MVDFDYKINLAGWDRVLRGIIGTLLLIFAAYHADAWWAGLVGLGGFAFWLQAALGY